MCDISVIIRCKDEERWIGHTIQSCIDLIKNPEIVIVDNNSIDDSLKIARSFAHDPSLEKSEGYTEIKFVNIDDYTPGKAINLGVRNSSNDTILIISSHCVLKKINVKEIKKHLNDYLCIFGNQNPYYCGKRIKKRF